MSDLRNAISQLATQFATGVLEAIRGASLEDILLETRGGGAKRGPAPRAVHVRSAAVAREAGPVVAHAAPAAKPKKRGRLGRRSAGDITQVVGRIVALLGQHAKGLRAEQIRAKLGLDAKELPRPITQALAERKITKQGEKRATTYFAGAGKAVAAAKPAAKAGSRPAKAAKSPTVAAKSPTKATKSPTVAAKSAAKGVKSPAVAAKLPRKGAKSPVVAAKSPAKGAKSPVVAAKSLAKAAKPRAKAAKPATKAAKPTAKAAKPAKTAKPAAAKAAKPAKTAKPAVAKATKPAAKITAPAEKAPKPAPSIEEAVTIATHGVPVEVPN